MNTRRVLIGDDRPIVIVCVPEDHDHYRRATLHEASCGHRVWVAPSTEPAIAAGGRLVCTGCFDPSVVKPTDELCLAPGGDKELAEEIGIGATDQFMSMLHSLGFQVTELADKDND